MEVDEKGMNTAIYRMDDMKLQKKNAYITPNPYHSHWQQQIKKHCLTEKVIGLKERIKATKDNTDLFGVYQGVTAKY